MKFFSSVAKFRSSELGLFHNKRFKYFLEFALDELRTPRRTELRETGDGNTYERILPTFSSVRVKINSSENQDALKFCSMERNNRH